MTLIFPGQNATNSESYLFLRKELPVRLANIMKEIKLLPEHLLHMPSVCAVSDLYRMSFVDLLEFEKGDCNDSKILDKYVYYCSFFFLTVYFVC